MAVVGNDVKTIEQDTQSHNNVFHRRKGFASNLYTQKKKYQEVGEYVQIMRKRKYIWII